MPKIKNGNKILLYSETQMLNALQAVKNGMPVLEASRTFQVPRTTLTYKLSGKYPVERKMGPESYISKTHEEILVNWIIESQKRGFPISRHQLAESVKKLVTDLNLKTPFKHNKPGKKWMELFLHRHPEISERIPQTLTVPRAAVTEDKLFSWFNEIELYIKENNLTDAITDPSKVFNADESAFFLNPNGGKVLAQRGHRNVYQLGNDEKECLTVLFTANAAGMIPPPMLIFKYQRVPSYIVSSVPKGWGIGRSESGWMCGPTFYEYMANIFKPWLDENNIARPVIFFIDGHVSHLTLHVSEFCSANGIILICLVANATHIMQPMDVSVFRPLKAAWKQSIKSFKHETKLVTIKKEHAGIILKKALDNLDLQGTVANGFRACGLFPFTRDGIDLSVLHMNSSMRNETEAVAEDTLHADIGSHVAFIESLLGAEKINSFKKLIETTGEWVGSPNDSSLFDFYKKVYLLAKTGATEAAKENANESGLVHLSDDPQHNSTPNNSPVKEHQEAAKSFEGTLPSPFKRSFCWPEVSVKKNKRRKEHIPFVVSSTAYQQYYVKKLAKKKEGEEAKQKRKETREQKKSCKQNNKNKKSKSTSSESELSESQMSLYSDTESEDFDNYVSEEDLKKQSYPTGECSKSKEKNIKTQGKLFRKKNKEEIQLSSFVAVIYENEFFPGQVLKIKDGQYFVKAMAMSGYNWKWPATEDTCWYDECDVLQALSEPQKINERGTFRVPEIDELRNMRLK